MKKHYIVVCIYKDRKWRKYYSILDSNLNTAEFRCNPLYSKESKFMPIKLIVKRSDIWPQGQ